MGVAFTAADRWLERALLLGVVGHVVALAMHQPRVAMGADVLVTLAMLRVQWLSRIGALAGLALAIAAFFVAPPLAWIAWTFCFVRARAWSRPLSFLTAVLVIASGLNRVVADFVMPLWLGLCAEAVLFRVRPFEPYGRLARWTHPHFRLFDLIANSRVFGALLEPLPELTMRSDITDVVYVNYLIPSDVAAALVPPGLELQRLGPDGKYALFSFLTYQHGHFGFAFLGPLRRLMPSPVQTNWRIHVFDPRTKHQGIYFLSNAITSTIPALAARLLTEGMPMHVLRHGVVRRGDDGALAITLDPGRGSAPDAEMRLLRGETPILRGAWASCFPDYRAFLAYCVPQDRAMSSQPLRGRISRQEIDLGIPLDACTPLEGSVTSRAAAALAGDAEPLVFHVPSVSFTFSVEAHDSFADGQNQ